MTSLMYPSTGSKVQGSHSFQPSFHTFNSISGPVPSERRTMAPRSFRLDTFGSSAVQSTPPVAPPAKTSPPSTFKSSMHYNGPTGASSFGSYATFSPTSSSLGSVSFGPTSNAIGISVPQTKKRTRVMTTEYQVARLTEVLNETMFPTTVQREQLAEELDMTPRRIQVWFQNKRQSLRRRRDDDDSSTSLSRQESYAEDFDENSYSAVSNTLGPSIRTQTPPSLVPSSAKFSRSPGSATLPPLDTSLQAHLSTTSFAPSATSSSSTTPTSTATGSSSRSLFTSYREPETPATPEISPYEGSGGSAFFSNDKTAPKLRRCNSYFDAQLPSTLLSQSAASGSFGTLSLSPNNTFPPALSHSPFRSQSPYRAPSPSYSSGLLSATSTGFDNLKLQQPHSMFMSRRSSPPRRGGMNDDHDSTLRLPPARDLIREADAMMQTTPHPSRMSRRNSFRWER